MHRFSLTLARLSALACLSGWSALWAAEPGNEALTILLDQNRAMSAEIQALRALVEEQGFEIRKLQRESLDRYADIDSRLRSLEQGQSNPSAASPAITTVPTNNAAGSANTAATAAVTSSAPGGATANPSPVDPGNEALTGNVSGITPAPGGLRANAPVTAPVNANARPTLQPAVVSEQELYQMAYESAINSQFERAIAEFDQYLSIYPNGRFTTNAHYWKGQSYLYLSKFQEAVAAYEIILQQYPDAAKVPDAMYGLGVAFEGLGNIARARQLMQDIKRRFPNTGVANLADTRLLSLQ